MPDKDAICEALQMIQSLTTEEIIDALRPHNLLGATILGTRDALLGHEGAQKWNCWVHVREVPQGYKGETLCRNDGTAEISTYLHLTPIDKVVSECVDVYGENFLAVTFLEALD